MDMVSNQMPEVDVGGLGDDEVNEEEEDGLEEAVGVEEDEDGLGEDVGGFGDDDDEESIGGLAEELEKDCDGLNEDVGGFRGDSDELTKVDWGSLVEYVGVLRDVEYESKEKGCRDLGDNEDVLIEETCGGLDKDDGGLGLGDDEDELKGDRT
ncbi:hypothetical protein EV1_022409 [Malus domestica]